VGLAATKIGVGQPEQPFAGVVRSVFVNSTIISVDKRLVTLVPDEAGGLPYAISVDVPKGFDFRRFLAIGDAVATRAGVLRFAGGESVDLRAARAWRSHLDDILVDFANPATARAWRTVAAALADDGRSDAIARLAPAAIWSLADATRRLDQTSAGQAAECLVGLGAGGTPAGDDLLVGYLTGVWSSVAQAAHRAFAAGLGKRVRKLAERTNDVSRTYLEAAAVGEVSERLTVLARAIAIGASPPVTLAAATAAISVGHTSGSDGTLGLLMAFAAFGPEPVYAASRRLIKGPRH